jgi:hypothetical protein
MPSRYKFFARIAPILLRKEEQMKFNTMAAGAVAASLAMGVAHEADAKVYTNRDFREWRDHLKNDGLTEFQAKKYCERLEGSRVHFESHVYSVRPNGVISADMDGDALWSLPEVELRLLDEDQTESVKKWQNIEYVGNILDCSFNSTSGMLSLHIANGQLVLHY